MTWIPASTESNRTDPFPIPREILRGAWKVAALLLLLLCTVMGAARAAPAVERHYSAPAGEAPAVYTVKVSVNAPAAEIEVEGRPFPAGRPLVVAAGRELRLSANARGYIGQEIGLNGHPGQVVDAEFQLLKPRLAGALLPALRREGDSFALPAFRIEGRIREISKDRVTLAVGETAPDPPPRDAAGPDRWDCGWMAPQRARYDFAEVSKSLDFRRNGKTIEASRLKVGMAGVSVRVEAGRARLVREEIRTVVVTASGTVPTHVLPPAASRALAGGRLTPLARLRRTAWQVQEASLPRYAEFDSGGRRIEVRRKGGADGPVVVTVDGRDRSRLRLPAGVPEAIPAGVRSRWRGGTLTLDWGRAEGREWLAQRSQYRWDGENMRLTGYDRCRVKGGAEAAARVLDEGRSDLHTAEANARALLELAQAGRWDGLASQWMEWRLISDPAEADRFAGEMAEVVADHPEPAAAARIDLEKMEVTGLGTGKPIALRFSLGGGMVLEASPGSARLLAPCCQGASTVSEPGAALLRTGSYYPSELDAGSGEDWLALRREGAEDWLEWERLEVGPSSGGIREKSVAVEVPGAPAPLCILRNVAGLQPGAVAAARVEGGLHGSGGVYAGSPVTVRMGDDRTWRLEMDDKGRIVLRHGGRWQILGTPRPMHSGRDRAVVEWAGEMDGDGELDLILDMGGYNTTEWTLYLSAGSRHGHMLRRVTSFVTHGC